jgi:hypothetical protein
MDPAAKQQVIERVKQAQNILVTVSTNPSVDQLAACIGLTLLLNKMGKHATAVFSGQVPSTIEFLQPEKTIEHNTDSLRDFIVSLDKEKADKLRYKVEDQVVKIFITPYKTSLSEKDLVFSQGDFNVEVVMALGIKDKNQVDAAITAHGRILHDSTVIAINDKTDQAPNIGQINWQEPTASSLSEMLVSISEAFGPNLIDNQMATAFLTGIVSATKRFSNTRTTPKVMTMSAQLMAAGANQQLIVSKLEPPVPVWKPGEKPVALPPVLVPEEKVSNKKPEGTLTVNHKTPAGGNAEDDASTTEIHIDKEGNIHHNDEPPLDLNTTTAPLIETIADAGVNQPQDGLEATPPSLSAEGAEAQPDPSSVENKPSDVPAVNTPVEVETPESAALPTSNMPQQGNNPLQDEDSDNMPGSHNVLSPLNGGPVLETAFTANTQPEWSSSSGSTDPFSQGETPANPGFLTHAPAVQPLGPSGPSVVSTSHQNMPEAETPPHIDQARNAVDSAYATAPFNPDLSPVQSLNAVPLGELHPPQAQDSSGTNDMSPVAPPPLPPPIISAPGVVIPPPYNPSNNNHS